MLDPKWIRDSTDEVFAQLARRSNNYDVEYYLSLEKQRKALQVEVEQLQAESKKKSKELGQIKSAGGESKDLLKVNEKIKLQLKEKEKKFQSIREELHQFLLELPNVPDTSVPDGKDENDNQEIDKYGEPPKFDFPIRDHVEVGETLGLLDLSVAATIAGARFAVAYSDLARLYRALEQFMLDVHTSEHGYREVYLPHIANRESLIGTGQLPKFEEDLFHLSNTDYYLIPTAEVPLVNLYRDTIIDSSELPIKLVSGTSCFRSEAGAYGKDTRGIIRQHQFEKVELVQFTHPEHSFAALEEIKSNAQTILRKLGLAYRTVNLCTGDLGFAATKTYDIEVWIPSQNCYREISSCSNTLAFQARRLKIRMRGSDKKETQFVHILNGSGLAVGRTLVAVIENYQTKDGQIEIPEALYPYMNGCKIISKNN